MVLCGGVLNYYYVVIPFGDDIEVNAVDTTSNYANESLNIINAYSEKEKVDNVNKIIFLYEKVIMYLEPLENFMIESMEAILHYSYILFIVPIINIILIYLLLRKSSR